jgi:hypothetical protein
MAPDDWTRGMLIQIARDIELIKMVLGVDRNEEGGVVQSPPPGGSVDARDIARVLGVPQDGDISQAMTRRAQQRYGPALDALRESEL